MNNPAFSPTTSSLAERMAWMHEPVHLGHVRLPWFLRWHLERALHRMFCTLEQALLTLLDLQRQGKLEPWPEATLPPRPQKPYQLKLTPPVSSRSAGSVAAPSPVLANEVAQTALGDAGEAVTVGLESIACALPICPRQSPFAPIARRSSRVSRMAGGLAIQRPSRCRQSMVFKPVGALWDNCVQIVPVY